MWLSQQQFEINERRLTVNDPACLAITAPGIKRACTRVGVPGVKTNGITGPIPGDCSRFLEDTAANTIPLPVRMHGHANEVQRFVYAGEIRCVGRPGLLGLPAQRSNESRPVARDDGSRKLRTAEIAQHTAFCGRR
jgi:hypothetical protein